MASVISTHHNASGWSAAVLWAPLRAVGRFVVLLAEAHSHARALHRLSQRSDYELAARGLTRDGEIRRIMGVSATL